MRCKLLFFAFLFGFVEFLMAQTLETITLTIGKEPITLEVARTAKAQKTGLMHRENLADNAGMIFLFNRPQFTGFWMKDTPLDLDIAFLDAEGVVFHTDTMKANTEDIHYSYGLATYAIELKKGSLKRLGIGVGSKIPEIKKAKNPSR